MSIYRTNNPLEYAQVDGIVIDERAPESNVQPAGTGVAILVGQFQRGTEELYRLASGKDFFQKYGRSSFPGNIALKNKKFAVLKVIGVKASDSVKATKTFQNSTPVNAITFTAKSKGAYGNSIKVKIEAGSVSGKKYTVSGNDSLNADNFSDEVYDNVAIASITSLTFADSKLVDVVVVLNTSEPANIAETNLISGSDGTITDADYSAAIDKAAVEGAGNILFLDVYNDVRNGYLKLHAAETTDKMVICAGVEGDSVANAIADVASLRDTEGRIIMAFNWVKTLIDGLEVYTSPASWYASILSQTSPNLDPAYSGNTQYLYGVIGFKLNLSRDEYIQLMAAGISAFEQDLDIGPKIKSGVVTQIADSEKVTVLRRRMADYLTASIGKFLKIYQNDVNSKEKRTSVKSGMLRFIQSNENDGILPKDSEVIGGKAKLVDIDSENDNDSIAAGKFIILYKQRIFSSMRFIVLKAEIGQSVVVTEQE